MIRNEIENYTFTFRFMTKLNKEYRDKLTNFNYYNEKDNTFDFAK